MTAEQMKQAAAEAAIEHVPPGAVVGVGTGSTVNFFIEALGRVKGRVEGAVASSKASAERLRRAGIPLLELNSVEQLPIYVDGADEVTRRLHMIKGGGGALTGEKIVAAVARRFVCIADEGKLKDVLGGFPLPIEVIPLARAYVGREMARLGGQARLREGFVSDYGNIILDVHGLAIPDPVEMETAIDRIAGVVTSGLFARRRANLLLLGTPSGVRSIGA